jgi:phosphoribosylformylglycinamidine synthase
MSGYDRSFKRLFLRRFLSEGRTEELIEKLKPILPGLKGIETEKVFCVESDRELKPDEESIVNWLAADLHRPKDFSDRPFLGQRNVMEVAPLLNFETADSTNAVSVCRSCTVRGVSRLEQGRRYGLLMDEELTDEQKERILPLIRDKMTEGYYPQSLLSFKSERKPEAVARIPVLEKGMTALVEANKKYGTGLDEADLNFLHFLLGDVYKRNPTDVEFCDFGNSFSEHSRHHLFNARIIIDGVAMPFTLFELVKATLKNHKNSIIAFHDNGSAIKGRPIRMLLPNRPGFPSPARMLMLLYHYVLTCETHNHPCLIEAFGGAGTGGRGRVRDNGATGRGGVIGSGISGFVGGNLNIPGYFLPWEDPNWRYNPKVETGLSFFTKATLGDFGAANEHGEPAGLYFAESYGFQVGNQRWENIKPIMFTGGCSFIDSRHVVKEEPQPGMLIIHVGGFARRIGRGGASASSLMHGENKEELDWDSVQRADGEMANKLDKLITTLVQMGLLNPIRRIEDQGAGGPLNNIKELVKNLLKNTGAKLYLTKIPLGDQTLSEVEIGVCEYQECMAFLIWAEDWPLVKTVADRLKCPCNNVGVVTDDGKFVVYGRDESIVEEFELKHLFGEYPQKTFEDKRIKLPVEPLVVPAGMTVRQGMELVPRLMGVTSREWMAHIVDRIVRTCLAQQMCVGPALLPINHYSITTPSNYDYSGQVNAVGHRSPIGLISPEALVRMVVADALMGAMFAPISARNEIKASANWMLAAKLEGGLAWLYDAMYAYRLFTDETEVDTNGGKDSLTTASKVPTEDGSEEIVRSLSTLVFTLQADCPDFRLKVTPDIKRPGESRLMFVDLAKGFARMGGSAFAQVLGQTGDTPPDVNDPRSFNQAFDLVQEILRKQLILSGQKRVRGGLLQTVSEMAYAANCGLQVAFSHPSASLHEILFNEEIGCVLEYLPQRESELHDLFCQAGFEGHIHLIGRPAREKQITATFNGAVILDERMPVLRDIWRDTSYQMKQRHKTRRCVEAERRNLYDPPDPTVKLTFDPDLYPPVEIDYPGKPRVAVLEEEGCNSLIEMMDFVYAGGFEPWPITMTDLQEGRVSLKWFRGLTPVPGFSFKDVLGAGKGWAGSVKFNPTARQEFDDFFARPDTWSYFPCNAAQFILYLKYLLNLPEEISPLFITNLSEGFESRFPYVRIFESPAIAFKDLEGSVIPIHIDHGQGRLYSPDPKVIEMLLEKKLAPIRFVDMYGTPAGPEDYPFNPNGSPEGIAGICDPTGRHFAGMPHWERTHRRRHFHYWPREWDSIENSPWLRVIHNYRIFCETTKDLSIEPPREMYEKLMTAR